MRKLDDIKFDALRNALYHKARQRRLDFLNRMSNFLVIFLGTATVAKGFGAFAINNSELFIGTLTALLGALKLVFDWSGRARTHEILQKKYFDIVADISELKQTDNEILLAYDAKLFRLYGEEPPPLRALESVSYNEARDAVGSPSGSMDNIVITKYQNMMKHILSFHSTEFKTRLEIEKMQAGKIKMSDDSKTKGVGTRPPPPQPPPSPIITK